MTLQKEERGSIIEICFRRFSRGFSDAEIVKELNYKPSTVKFYRNKHFNKISNLEYYSDHDNYNEAVRKVFLRTHVLPDHKKEMDYGTAPPVYLFNELGDVEKELINDINHKKLKNY